MAGVENARARRSIPVTLDPSLHRSPLKFQQRRVAKAERELSGVFAEFDEASDPSVVEYARRAAQMLVDAK